MQNSLASPALNTTMAKEPSSELDLTAVKFWFLFVVGLVVIVSLYKGFMGPVTDRSYSKTKTKVKGHEEKMASKKRTSRN